MDAPPPAVPDLTSPQAQQIWSMLDDLAASDPAAYRKFIDKQLKEGREELKPPQPHMCVQSMVIGGSAPTDPCRVYINVFEWTRIPAPKDDQAPIPVVGGDMYSVRDKLGICQVVAVAFNPSVLAEFGRESPLVEERRMLIGLAIDYLGDVRGIKISRDYTLLKEEDGLCKGPVGKATDTLMKFQQKKTDKQTPKQDDSLLGQLSNLTVAADNEIVVDDSSPPAVEAEPRIRLPGAPKQDKTPAGSLVQELEPSPEAGIVEPAYEVSLVDDGRTVSVKVDLTGVMSVSECQLDISQDEVELLVPGLYHLSLSLPHTIQEQDSRAKFSKKSQTLTLRLPREQTGS